MEDDHREVHKKKKGEAKDGFSVQNACDRPGHHLTALRWPFHSTKVGATICKSQFGKTEGWQHLQGR